MKSWESVHNIDDIKRFTSMNDIVRTIYGDSSLKLSNKETIIIREILDVIVSIEFSNAFYDEVVVRILRAYNNIYKHIFKNKHDIDNVIAGLCRRGLVTVKTEKFTSGKDNEIKVSRWCKLISLNKKISKSEMDDILLSLVRRGFPEK